VEETGLSHPSGLGSGVERRGPNADVGSGVGAGGA
jgi:hypothetical protein